MTISLWHVVLILFLVFVAQVMAFMSLTRAIRNEKRQRKFEEDISEWGVQIRENIRAMQVVSNTATNDIKGIRERLHRTIDSMQALIYWQEEMTSPQKGLKTAIAAADRAEIRAKAKEIPDEKAETKET